MLKLATKFSPQRAAFEQAHCAGFRAAELWLDDAFLADWQQVAKLAGDYPFQYVMHFPNQMQLAQASLEHAAALYRELGCRTMVIHQQQFDKFSPVLLQLEPTMRLAIENHILQPAAFERWASRNPGLTLDVEHLWKFTLQNAAMEDLLARVRDFLLQFGEKLQHVHLPGYFAGSLEHRPMYCSREMVFEVFSLLHARDFTGLVVSEIDPDYQFPNDLRMDVLLFDTWRNRVPIPD